MNIANVGSFVVAALALLVSFLTNIKRDTRQDTTQIATIMAKLDSISEDIRDVKKDVAGLRQSVQDNHDRILKLEMSLDTAWKRIDEIRGITEGGARL